MKRNRGGWREGEGRFWGGNEREGSLEEVWTYERRGKKRNERREVGGREGGRMGMALGRWGVGALGCGWVWRGRGVEQI